MLSLVRSKITTPGLLLALAVALAFLIGALVNQDAEAGTQLPGIESAAAEIGD